MPAAVSNDKVWQTRDKHHYVTNLFYYHTSFLLLIAFQTICLAKDNGKETNKYSIITIHSIQLLKPGVLALELRHEGFHLPHHREDLNTEG